MKTSLAVGSILLFNLALGSGDITNLFKVKRPVPTGPPRNVSEIYMSYFSQKLDHFHDDDTTMWNQRYFVSTENFDATNRNVVFLMLGGEEEIDSNWMMYGQWVVSSRKYGALLMYLEHRFYGQSQPLPDVSIESLRYLSSEQALGDATEFIKSMNQVYNLAPDAKWIVFGGSYSGALAAWLRLKQPDLVYGAVCSSGPLLAELDFSDYHQVVIDDLTASSEQCMTSLTTALTQVEDLLANPKQAEGLTSIFNLCSPIEGLERNDIRVSNFFRTLLTPFSNAAQYSGQVKISIDDLCGIMTYEAAGKEIQRLANVKALVDGMECVNYDYMSYVYALKDTVRKAGDVRQWFYQTCNEFGWFQTSSRADLQFGLGVPIGYYTQLCSDVFGEGYTEDAMKAVVDQTNLDYGGLGIENTASNVVYIYGSADPWHKVGITESDNPNITVLYVEGMSHCQDMTEATRPETAQLTAAKKETDRMIGVWLGYN
ncbi:hypothetical protein NQ315_001043 [Exocentrus adspersus]|uniref:Serine protease K12H4.7 n=1 Tax=Exocentrus adspersus TaxID=1586481 RepID=A0AAV8WE85_9CUCU|nr:hypothetical protein NQ315_001043 [Exocentrus adspersus]